MQHPTTGRVAASQAHNCGRRTTCVRRIARPMCAIAVDGPFTPLARRCARMPVGDAGGAPGRAVGTDLRPNSPRPVTPYRRVPASQLICAGLGATILVTSEIWKAVSRRMAPARAHGHHE